jgi:hypothetical protein
VEGKSESKRERERERERGEEGRTASLTLDSRFRVQGSGFRV